MEVLTYVATLSDGSPLPSWLSFDATTQTFSGVPSRSDIGTLALQVTATDSSNDSVSSNFQIDIASDVPLFTVSDASYIEQGSAIVLDGDISFADGIDYRKGYLDFEVSDPTSSETLALITDNNVSITGGQVSIVGEEVYLGDGSQALLIGSVDSTFNGQNGQKLRVNFTTEFRNGDFNSGSPGSTIIDDWTVVNQQVKFGTDTIAGLPTPTDPTIQSNAPNSDQNTPASATYTSDLSANVSDGLGTSVRMNSSMTTQAGFDIVRGPYIYSDGTVNFEAGDQVSFEWRAQGGGDDYDVYGYIIDVNTNHIETILDDTGQCNTVGKRNNHSLTSR